jgi:hypothetical protein
MNDDAVERFKESRGGLPRLVVPAPRPQAIAPEHVRCTNYWHGLYQAHGDFSECSRPSSWRGYGEEATR